MTIIVVGVLDPSVYITGHVRCLNQRVPTTRFSAVRGRSGEMVPIAGFVKGTQLHLGVSIHGLTRKWMVFIGKIPSRNG